MHASQPAHGQALPAHARAHLSLCLSVSLFMVGWLVGWSVGRLVGWLVGWCVGVRRLRSHALLTSTTPHACIQRALSSLGHLTYVPATIIGAAAVGNDERPGACIGPQKKI